MRIVALVMFAALMASAGSPVAAAPVPKHLMKEPESDQGKFQGKWKLQGLKMGGMDLGNNVPQTLNMLMELRGDKLIVSVNLPGQAMKSTATVKFDSKAKRISATQVEVVDGDGKPVNNPGPTTQAMGYALDGDKLVFASDQTGAAAADPTKPGANTVVMTFTRVKE